MNSLTDPTPDSIRPPAGHCSDTPAVRPFGRRAFLKGVGGAMVAGAVVGLAGEPAALAVPRFRISLADRGAGFRQQAGVFDFARRVGMTAGVHVAGVEVDCGRLGHHGGMDNRLLTAAGRRQCLAAAGAAGRAISSLALTAFTSQSFAEHPKGVEYAKDLLFAMREMGVRVGLLPVRIDNDYVRGLAVDRLKALAPVAQRDGLTIAIDAITFDECTGQAPMPASAVRDLLDAVGSPAVKAVVHAGCHVTAADSAAALAVLSPRRVAQVRYRPDPAGRSGEALRPLAGILSTAGWDGWFVLDRPAAVTGDPADDVSLSVGRLGRALTPAFA